MLFCRKLVKVSQNLSSSAVVIGALRVNRLHIQCLYFLCSTSKLKYKQMTTVEIKSPTPFLLNMVMHETDCQECSDTTVFRHNKDISCVEVNRNW